MAKYGLALHTSSPELGLAIGDLAGGDYRSQTWPLGRDTSNVLHSYLAQFIQPQSWSDLAWLAVAIGPGGFTGTRLAVVTARTLGQQLQIPVFSVSSLAALAWCHIIMSSFDEVALSLPAQRGQVFTGIYRIDRQQTQLEVLQPDLVTTPAAAAAARTQIELQVAIEPGANLGYTVDAVWELAQIQWTKGDRPTWPSVIPFYGQSPV